VIDFFCQMNELVDTRWLHIVAAMVVLAFGGEWGVFQNIHKVVTPFPVS